MRYIFDEVMNIYDSLEPGIEDQFIDTINDCKGNIIGLGAGRMGYSLKAFIMRLSHLGFSAYMIGDTTLPRIREDDLVIVNSSSGETSTIVLLSQIAKDSGAKLVLLSSNKGSTIAKLADFNLIYSTIESGQLMKTAYEQFSFLFLDQCAYRLSKRVHLGIDEIEMNHSVLE